MTNEIRFFIMSFSSKSNFDHRSELRKEEEKGQELLYFFSLYFPNVCLLACKCAKKGVPLHH